MDGLYVALIASLPGLVLGGLSWWTSRGKVSAEARKTDAETDSIYSQVADRWMEHVNELQEKVKQLDLDISQVRRENEYYRVELTERDEIIGDLKNWAERLIKQLAQHAPDVLPEEFRRTLGETTTRRLRVAHPRYGDADSKAPPLDSHS